MDFTAIPATLWVGEPTVVRWHWQLAQPTPPAPQCSITPGVGVIANGASSLVTLSQTTSFLLICTNRLGRDAAQMELTAAPAQPPVILTFTASPSAAGTGVPLDVLWHWTFTHPVAEPLRCTIDRGVGDVQNGSVRSITIAADTTFTLTCSDAFGTAHRDLVVPALPPPRADTFAAVSAGLLFTCGLETDGHLRCWGDNGAGQATPPAGDFVAVSATKSVCYELPHGGDECLNAWACGIRADHSIACWGDDHVGEASPPAGSFLAVDASSLCGIRTDGSVACWGNGPDLSPVNGLPAKQLDGPCAIMDDGSITCWNTFGVDWRLPPPPVGSFVALSVGGPYACAIGTDHTLVCWGRYDNGTLVVPPSGSFVGVAGRAESTCALSADSTLVCWGPDMSRWGWPPGGDYSSLSAGDSFCAVGVDHSLHCWGDDGWAGTPPPGHAVAVSVSPRYVCDIDRHNRLGCWNVPGVPFPYGPPATPELGPVVAVSAGSYHGCAIDLDDRVGCWGIDGAPAGHFVALGSDPDEAFMSDGPMEWLPGYTCAIAVDDTVTCWGASSTLPSQVQGNFAMLSIGGASRCALRTDGTVACWEDGHGSLLVPPAGSFAAVSTSGWYDYDPHACGIRTDGSVACWGDNSFGESTPPPGLFVEIAVGLAYSCAIGADGTLQCWGASFMSQSLPAGHFVALSATATFACAISVSGEERCWGSVVR